HETLGNWTEALNCYELALQNEPNNIEYHLHLLECLKNLGHYQTILNSIEGSLHLFDKKQQKLIKSYGIKSAWRLGKWEIVEKYLIDCDDDNDFEISLSKLLLQY